MSTDSTTEELLAVARSDAILSGFHADPSTAQQELAQYEANMRSLGLEPDVKLVTLTRRTSYSKVKDYTPDTEPTPDTVEAEQQDDTPPAA